MKFLKCYSSHTWLSALLQSSQTPKKIAVWFQSELSTVAVRAASSCCAPPQPVHSRLPALTFPRAELEKSVWQSPTLSNQAHLCSGS